MNVLITMMGRSVWGLFNSSWAALRQRSFVPQRIYILTAGCDRNDAEIAARMLKVLMREHGSDVDVRIETVPEEDVAGVAETVKRITTSERQTGARIALDVTPGKKSMVIGALLSGLARNEFDQIFYLYLEDLRNAARPYIEIPLHLQKSHDILKEGKPGAKEEG